MAGNNSSEFGGGVHGVKDTVPEKVEDSEFTGIRRSRVSFQGSLNFKHLSPYLLSCSGSHSLALRLAVLYTPSLRDVVSAACTCRGWHEALQEVL